MARVGQTCAVAGRPRLGRCAVRFVGATRFAAGVWVGLQIPHSAVLEGLGRNDGSLRGVRYFTLINGEEEGAMAGLFVREQAIEDLEDGTEEEDVVEGEQPQAPPVEVQEVGPREVLPTSPNKQAQGTPSRIARPPSAAATTPSAAPDSVPASFAEAFPSATTPQTKTPPAAVSSDASVPSTKSSSSSSSSNTVAATSTASAPAAAPASADDRTRAEQISKLLASVADLEAQKRAALETSRSLQTRVRELSSSLEAAQEAQRAAVRVTQGASAKERDSMAREIEKLRADLARAAAEHKVAIEALQDDLEALTLDKEIAEERCSDLEEQLEDLRAKLELAEIQATREASAGADSSGDSVSAADLRLQNERLTAALMKVRDLSRAEKEKVDLELKELRNAAGRAQDLEEKVLDLEVQVEQAVADKDELQEMVDEATGNESLIEDLTAENLRLGDKLQELQSSYQELEELHDMSEELEEAQRASAQRLKAELYAKEVQLLDAQSVAKNARVELQQAAQSLRKYSEANALLRAQLQQAMKAAESLEGDVTEASAEHQRLASAAAAAQHAATTVAAARLDLRLAELKEAQALNVANWASAVFPVQDTFIHETGAAQLLMFLQRVQSKAVAAVEFLESAAPSTVLLGRGGAKQDDTVDVHALITGTCPLTRSLHMLSASVVSLYGSGFAAYAADANDEAEDKSLPSLRLIYEDVRALESGSVDALLKLFRTTADAKSEASQATNISLMAASLEGSAARRQIDDLTRRLMHFSEQQHALIETQEHSIQYSTQRRQHSLFTRIESCVDSSQALLAEWSRHGFGVQDASPESNVLVDTRIRRVLSRLSQIMEKIGIDLVLPKAEDDGAFRQSLDDIASALTKLVAILRAVNERMDATIATAAANLVSGSTSSAVIMLWQSALQETSISADDSGDDFSWLWRPLDSLLASCSSLYSDYLAPGIGVEPQSTLVALNAVLAAGSAPSEDGRLARAAKRCRAQLATSATALQRLADKDMELQSIAQESRERADALQKAKWELNRLTEDLRTTQRTLRESQQALADVKSARENDKAVHEQLVDELQRESANRPPVESASTPKHTVDAVQAASAAIQQQIVVDGVEQTATIPLPALLRALEDAEARNHVALTELARIRLERELPPLNRRTPLALQGDLVRQSKIREALREARQLRLQTRSAFIESSRLVDLSHSEHARSQFEKASELRSRLSSQNILVSANLRQALSSAYGNDATLPTKAGVTFVDPTVHRVIHQIEQSANPFAKIVIRRPNGVAGSSGEGPVRVVLSRPQADALRAALVRV